MMRQDEPTRRPAPVIRREARYFICATPLAKIYIRSMQQQLLEHPEMVYDRETPFSFTVNSGTRGILVEYNKPQMVIGFDRDDQDGIFNWLTGGPNGTDCQQTDIYGIVPFEPNIDMAATFDMLSQLEEKISSSAKAAKEYKKIQDDARQKMRAARDLVVKQSEFRVKRAMRFIHNALTKQYQINAEQNIGKYAPSVTEQFGMHVLDKEIEARAQRGADMRKKVNETMARTMVI